MINLLLSLLLCILIDNPTEEIKGIWLNPEKTRSIRIFESKGKFFGVMHWIGKADPELKIGQLILKNLVYKDGSFTKGSAFVSSYGWVNCEAELKKGQLYITGHKLGFSRTRCYTKTH